VSLKAKFYGCFKINFKITFKIKFKINFNGGGQECPPYTFPCGLLY